MTVTGTDDLVPLTWTTSVASHRSRRVSCWRGCMRGRTTVVEPRQSRDHGERMLREFGAAVTVTPAAGVGFAVSVEGSARLRPTAVAVPGDISSAAFPLVAALLADGSDVELESVGMNPTRTGVIDALRAMGADIEEETLTEAGALEPIANLRVRGRARGLRAIDLGPEYVPRTIDEYPASL